jgi:hypothetical protein
LTPEKEELIKWATGSLFAAGADTVCYCGLSIHLTEANHLPTRL